MSFAGQLRISARDLQIVSFSDESIEVLGQFRTRAVCRTAASGTCKRVDSADAHARATICKNAGPLAICLRFAYRLSHHESGFASLTFSSGALTMTPSPRPTTPLRQRMIEDMKIRNLSPHTIQAYVDRVAAFAKHFGKSPQLLGAKEVRAYLVFLVEEKRVSWSYYGQAICALRFLYRVVSFRLAVQYTMLSCRRPTTARNNVQNESGS
jgi:Phage integrase, N-terminal SAM-like domain